MSEDSVEQLMVAYQQGDVEAFNRLYGHLSPRLYGYLGKRLDCSERDEVLQQFFLKLHSSRQTYKKGHSLWPWVFSVLRSILADHWKKQSALPKGNQTVETLEAEPALFFNSAYVDGLSAEEKSLLQKKYVEGLSYREMAKELDTTETALRKKVNRLIKTIREKEINE